MKWKAVDQNYFLLILVLANLDKTYLLKLMSASHIENKTWFYILGYAMYG